ncbi:hypothetical protein ACN6LF_001372 [[Kitasatospora] papulosa]|uniref:hypothetical protein n=1 Tax=[Kitasatospora] papulosa TaxID=1464011 RepID=UPI00403CFD0F
MSDRKDFIRVVRTSTTRGQLDLVAIERAVNGTAPEGMTCLELHEATRILIGQGLKARQISTQLRVPVATLRAWFPVELAPRVVDTSPYVCGTTRAYPHCKKEAGRACAACRKANSDQDYASRRLRAFGKAA